MSEENLYQKLEGEIDQCDWSMLAPHVERGAVFLVDKGLTLPQVGVALAEDDVASVKSWHENEQLRLPRESEKEDWQKSPHKKMADVLIIQPYVLIRLITEQ